MSLWIAVGEDLGVAVETAIGPDAAAELLLSATREPRHAGEGVTLIMLSKVIVVGFDGTAGARCAMSAAIDLARAGDYQLAVVHVERIPSVAVAGTLMSPGANALARFGVEVESALAEVCRAECADILDAAGVPGSFEIRRGSPADELMDVAASHNAAFIVVGRHGHHGLTRLFWRSVSQRLVHHARQPVLITPPPV